ncbi:MAG: hypothetical protein FJ122_02685 [Deltaproteobacteria bacterium]|nr:hypothetical protein [Deltaproteobacteria bacterium]
MFPHLSDSWLIILIACFLGFLIGQWIKARRNRVVKDSDYVNGLKKRLLAEQSLQTKKSKKKTRKALRKHGGL